MVRTLVVSLLVVVSLVVNSFAMSKTVKFILGSALLVGGAYMVYEGGRSVSKGQTVHTSSRETTKTTGSSGGTTAGNWGYGNNTYTSSTDTTVETITDTTVTNNTTTFNNKDMLYAGIGCMLLGTGVFAFVNPKTKTTTVGVQTKF